MTRPSLRSCAVCGHTAGLHSRVDVWGHDAGCGVSWTDPGTGEPRRCLCRYYA